MKKILALFLALVLIFSLTLTACDNVSDAPDTGDGEEQTTTEKPTTDSGDPDENQTGEGTTDEENTDGNQTTGDGTTDEGDPGEKDTSHVTDEESTTVGENQTADHEHSYEAVVTAPTCTKEGYTTHTCTICTDSYITDKVAARGHRYNSTVCNPTCEAEGYTSNVCSACKHAYNTDNVPATGHEWVDATYEAPKTCTKCGKTEGDKLPSNGQTLIVTYVDVGQGDCIFIKIGDCDILIDAGRPEYGVTVSEYLKSQNVDDVELVINTHYDNDHYGGLPQVFEDFVVEQAWGTPYDKSSTLPDAVRAEGLTLINPKVGTVFEYGGMTLTVVYDGTGARNSNDSSLVVMVEYGSFKFLFTGDISTTIEDNLVSSGADISCDVLKVGHHGSRSSSGSSFLRATGADFAVICVGTGNSYGHPTNDALNRLKSAGMDIYRTDLDGHVIFSTNGESMLTPEGDIVTPAASGISAASYLRAAEEALKLDACASTVESVACETKKNYTFDRVYIVSIAAYVPTNEGLKAFIA